MIFIITINNFITDHYKLIYFNQSITYIERKDICHCWVTNKHKYVLQRNDLWMTPLKGQITMTTSVRTKWLSPWSLSQHFLVVITHTFFLWLQFCQSSSSNHIGVATVEKYNWQSDNRVYKQSPMSYLWKTSQILKWTE